jgi:hypothetical protein
MTSKNRYRAALMILQSLIEQGVFFANSQEDRKYRIVVDSVRGTAMQRNRAFENFRFVFDPINDILPGKVCNICCDNVEPSDQQGEPVCFHCWLDGQTSPRFREKAVRERV